MSKGSAYITLVVNICGLQSNIGKLSNLCQEAKPTVVITVETLLDASIPEGADCISSPGYNLCC